MLASGMDTILGCVVSRLLQTAPENTGVALEEFGEAFWISLVVELDDSRMLSLGEYTLESYSGHQTLVAAVLVQKEYNLSDIEGKTIADVENDDSGVAIVLENGLGISCPGAPGGNYPWISTELERAECRDG